MNMLKYLKSHIPECLSFLLALLTLAFSDLTSFCSADETMLVEGPASLLNLGFWNTSYFRCPYSPLFLILLLGWMPIFGMSHMAISGLNVLAAFALSIILLRQARVRGWMTSSVAACACVILYWGCPAYAWLITAGRPDILAPLFTFLVLIELFPVPGTTRRSPWWLFLWSFCAMMTSATPIPVLVVVGAVLLLVEKGRRGNVFRQGLVFVAGVCAGLVVSCLFWAYFEDLLHFLYRFFSFGAAKVSEPLATKVRDAYSCDLIADAISCAVIALALLKADIRKNIRWSLVACACAAPLILTLAGRYYSNYLGLHFVPILACLFYVVAKHHNRWISWALLTISLVIAIYRPATEYGRWHKNSEKLSNAAQAIKALSDYLKPGTVVIYADGFAETIFYPAMQKGVRLWSLPRNFWGGEHDLTTDEKFERGMLKLLKDPAKVAKAKRFVNKVQSFPPELPSKDGVLISFDAATAKKAAQKLESLGFAMTYVSEKHELTLYKFSR